MAQKETIKNLTPAELKKQSKVLDEQREFTIDVNGQAYKLSHDIVFRQSKKAQLLNDMVLFFQKAVENVDILELATPYSLLLIFKHFTSLEVSSDIQEALETLEVLVDLELVEKIVGELPEEEIGDLYELMTNTINNMADNLKEAQEEAQRLSEQVQNEQVRDMIPNAND